MNLVSLSANEPRILSITKPWDGIEDNIKQSEVDKITWHNRFQLFASRKTKQEFQKLDAVDSNMKNARFIGCLDSLNRMLKLILSRLQSNF